MIWFVKKLLLPVAMLLFLIPPQVKYGNGEFKVIYLSIGFPAVAGCLILILRKEFGRYKNLLSLILLGLGFTAFTSFIGQLNDYAASYYAVLGLATCFAAIFYVTLYQKLYENTYFIAIIWDVFLAGCIHSFIVILSMINANLLADLQQYIIVGDKALISMGESKRFSGLAYTGFSFLSVLHALSVICGIAVYMGRKKRCAFLLVVGGVAQTLVIMNTGRSGIVALLIGVLILAQAYRSRRLSRWGVSIGLVLMLAAMVIALRFILISFPGVFGYTQDFALEAITNYRLEGRLATATTDTLFEEHILFPSGFISIIIGEGNSGRSESNYIPSDIGYVMMTFNFGIVGILLYFSVIAYASYRALKLPREYNEIKMLAYAVLVIYLVLNAKDDYYYSFTGHTQIMFLICVVVENLRLNPLRQRPDAGSIGIQCSENRKATLAGSLSGKMPNKTFENLGITDEYECTK